MPSARNPALSRLLAHLVPAQPVTLAAWRDEVETRYASKARSTRNRVGQAVRECQELAGAAGTTADLTPALLDRLASSAPGRMPATVNGLLRGLRAATGVAVEKGWLTESPFAGWEGWLDEDPDARRHHSRPAIGRVLAHLKSRSGGWDGGRLHALAAVLAYCGLRLKEALRLRVEEIDLDGGFLSVESSKGRKLKTRRSRGKVPMPDALVAVLRGWLPRCGSEWAFPGLRRRGAWLGGASGRRPTDLLKAAGVAVGVEGFTPQSLRRSLATHLVAHSDRPRLVQGVLRHARQTTTEIYIKRDLDAMRDAVRSFDYTDRPATKARPDRPHVLPRKRLGRRPSAWAQRPRASA